MNRLNATLEPEGDVHIDSMGFVPEGEGGEADINDRQLKRLRALGYVP